MRTERRLARRPGLTWGPRILLRLISCPLLFGGEEPQASCDGARAGRTPNSLVSAKELLRCCYSAGACLVIYRILQNSPLGPEDVIRLANASEQALKTIGVKERNDPRSKMIAKKIIEIGQTSLKDPVQICIRAVEALGLPKR